MGAQGWQRSKEKLWTIINGVIGVEENNTVHVTDGQENNNANVTDLEANNTAHVTDGEEKNNDHVTDGEENNMLMWLMEKRIICSCDWWRSE